MTQKTATFTAIIISLLLLIPGITLPMMTLKANINQQSLITHGKALIQEQQLPPFLSQMATGLLDGLKIEGEMSLIDKTQSILGTSQSLWEQGYFIVAVLIILFSTIFPCIKILFLGLFLFTKNKLLISCSSFLSKWSMADVFAIGVLIAFLMATAAEKDNALIVFHTELHQGFYWFVTYCLSSILLSLWLTKNKYPSI